MKQKKGIQLNEAFGAVLTLILVAVLVIVAIVIFVSLQTSFAGTTAASVTNETITQAALVAGSDSVSLGATSNCSSAGFSVSTVYNSTTNLLTSGNYSVTDAGVFSNLTSEFVDADWIVSYSYTWGSEACTAGEDMTDEFGNYTSLIGLVGTIIFLGLVIGVLVAAFAFGGKREV